MSKMVKIVELFGWGNSLSSEALWRTYLPDVPLGKRREVGVSRVKQQGMKVTRIVFRFVEGDDE